jgi:hypothetical protein
MSKKQDQAAAAGEADTRDESADPVPPDVHSEYQQIQLQAAASAQDPGGPEEPGGPPVDEAPPPTALFAYTPQNPGRNQAVMFDGSASTPGDDTTSVTAWDWLFNGTDQASGETVTWTTPNKSGSCDAVLTVTASDGQTAAETQTLSI